MFTRPFIDSLDFALKGGELSGEVPMAELPRMADLLTDLEGSISYALRGYAGEDGKPMLELSLEGRCNLRCQRCMKSLAYPVRLVSRLRLEQEEEALEADLEDEEADSIPAEKRMDVIALLEEELLLSLPIAPKHEVGVCSMAEGAKVEKPNPFAVLASLKKSN